MLDIDALKAFKLFADATESSLTALTDCGEEINFAAGQTIYQVGETSDRLYGVLEGEIALNLVFEEKILEPAIKYEEINESRYVVLKKPIRVSVAGRGNIFGWSALMPPRTRTLTAECLYDCRVISYSADRLTALFEKEPDLGYTVMRHLCELIYTHLEKRTIKLIEAWGQAFGTDEI
jgi:CRP/FNR family transcriptional regulator